MSRFTSLLVRSIITASMLVQSTGMTLAAADITPPGDVEKLKAEVGDQRVNLSWEAAVDDTGVSGYKIYVGPDEVTSTNEAKYAENKLVPDVTSYEITGLKNGATYYIAVTALDAAGNESESYSPYVAVKPFSKIVAAVNSTANTKDTTSVSKVTNEKTEKDTIASTGDDTTAPAVKKAESIYKNQVKVMFSEAVKLPMIKPDVAFIVQDNQIMESLKVRDAFVDPNDTSGKTVLLDTDDQNPSAEYLVTAGIEVEDLAGNPISSGNSDFATFLGSAVTLDEYLKLHPSAPKKDTTSTKDENGKGGGIVALATPAAAASTDTFRIASAEAVNDTTLRVTFSRPAIFSIDPTENFELTKKSDSKKLPLTSLLISEDKKVVTIATTLDMDSEYTVKVIGVIDQKGEEISSENSKFDFATQSAKKDTTPPEDVTNLVASALKNMAAKLKWAGSKNSAKDLLEYVIYKSTDGTAYGKLVTLSKESTAYESQELEPGYHYFKITAKDANGNESKGKTVKVRIVETGPGLGLIALASMGLGRMYRRRKKVVHG